MANTDSIKNTVIVTLLMCIVCSVVVSSAAVILKPAQQANKRVDFQRNILQAAGLYEEGVSVKDQFDKVTTKIVDLRTGKFVSEAEAGIAVNTYDQQKAAKDAALSTPLTTDQDIAKIGSRENFSLVYLVENEGQLSKIILPIKGYGLWSTLYGFIALEADANTVVGMGFYQHGETPGLGGEVDNPAWKSLWHNKVIYNETGAVAIEVVKGAAPEGAEHKVDGLSGATLTSKGVSNLVRFWMGENGFGPFLTNFTKGEA